MLKYSPCAKKLHKLWIPVQPLAVLPIMWLTQIFQIPSCLSSGRPLAHGSPGSWHTGSLYSRDSHTLKDKRNPQNAHWKCASPDLPLDIRRWSRQRRAQGIFLKFSSIKFYRLYRTILKNYMCTSQWIFTRWIYPSLLLPGVAVHLLYLMV